MIKIINAKKDDFQNLCKIYRKDYGKKVKERIKDYLEYHHIKLVKENEKIIGALFWFVRECPYHGLAEVEDFFINKEYRRRGLGTKLLKVVIKDIKNYFIKNGSKPRKIIILTSKNNTAARKCYETLGFKFVAELGDLFEDKNIETFYVLDLRQK